jgi:hypothetical protein
MPFDYNEYQKKCDGLTTEQLQLEWENYTRQIAGGATSTAASVVLSPLTAGISLVGLGLSAPRIHNARKKREIIEAGLQQRGATHNTRKRDVVGPVAVAGTISALTFGLAGPGADIIAGEAVGKGAEYVAAHVILDGAGAAAEHKHDGHLKKKGNRRIQGQAQTQNAPQQFVQPAVMGQVQYQNVQQQYIQPQMMGQPPQMVGYQQQQVTYQLQQPVMQNPQQVTGYPPGTQMVQPTYQQTVQVTQQYQYQQPQQDIKYEYVPVPAPVATPGVYVQKQVPGMVAYAPASHQQPDMNQPAPPYSPSQQAMPLQAEKSAAPPYGEQNQAQTAPDPCPTPAPVYAQQTPAQEQSLESTPATTVKSNFQYFDPSQLSVLIHWASSVTKSIF